MYILTVKCIEQFERQLLQPFLLFFHNATKFCSLQRVNNGHLCTAKDIHIHIAKNFNLDSQSIHIMKHDDTHTHYSFSAYAVKMSLHK